MILLKATAILREAIRELGGDPEADVELRLSEAVTSRLQGELSKISLHQAINAGNAPVYGIQMNGIPFGTLDANVVRQRRRMVGK